MPDPRIPIVAGVLLQEWRAEFVARPFEAVAARVVEALDRAAPVPATNRVEIVARALALNAGIKRWDFADEVTQLGFKCMAEVTITALSAAPRVTEVSDTMVERALDVWWSAGFHSNIAEKATMRAALSAALAGQDGEGGEMERENAKFRDALMQIARLHTELSGDFSRSSQQSDIARTALGGTFP